MAKVQVTLFWCKDADLEKTRVMTLIWSAREIGGRYGLEFEYHPAEVRDPRFVLDVTGDIITARDYALGLQTMIDVANQKVRGKAHTAFPTGSGRLPMVIGRLADMSPRLYLGQTLMATTLPDGTRTVSDWLPWCIVDPFRGEARPHCFLHEMAHAAGAVHNMELSAASSDLMIDGEVTTPVTMEPKVVDLMKRAYFYW
jgi:hypothetical protein